MEGDAVEADAGRGGVRGRVTRVLVNFVVLVVVAVDHQVVDVGWLGLWAVHVVDEVGNVMVQLRWIVVLNEVVDVCRGGDVVCDGCCKGPVGDPSL